jgi:zinc transport system permease protein
MILELLNYSFFKHALIASLLASIICGIIGTIVIEKRLVLMGGGIAHASFGGIGLGYLLGFEPIIGALFFAVGSGFFLNKVQEGHNSKKDAIMGMFWATGMALGILFISFTPGYPPDMTSYLFGDILTVSKGYLNIMAGLTVVLIMVIIPFMSYWKSYLLDPEFFQVIGYNKKFFDNILITLVSLSIVILIKVVGIILVISLLTVPPTIAKLHSQNISGIMLLSSLIGLFLCITGLLSSYMFNIPSGATIIILSAIVLVINLVIKSKK